MAHCGVSILLCILAISGLSVEAADEARIRLLTALFSDYDNNFGTVLPPEAKGTEIQFGMQLVRADVDAEEETVTANIWPVMQWTDSRFGWDPKEYDGVKEVRVPASLVWKPDMFLYNSIDKVELAEVNVLIYSSGKVLYIPTTRVQVDCPFEERTCDAKDGTDCSSNGVCIAKFKFGSWAYDGNTLDLQFYNKLENIDASFFIPRKGLKLVSTSAKREDAKYPGVDESYPNIEFTAVFETS